MYIVEKIMEAGKMRIVDYYMQTEGQDEQNEFPFETTVIEMHQALKQNLRPRIPELPRTTNGAATEAPKATEVHNKYPPIPLFPIEFQEHASTSTPSTLNEKHLFHV